MIKMADQRPDSTACISIPFLEARLGSKYPLLPTVLWSKIKQRAELPPALLIKKDHSDFQQCDPGVGSGCWRNWQVRREQRLPYTIPPN
jgi:hypothetical protein